MKFDESQFPAKEKLLEQPGPAPSSDCQFLKKLSQGDSDDGLELVTLDHPLQGPTSPRPLEQVVQLPQPPILPPALPGGSWLNLPDMGTAPTP